MHALKDVEQGVEFSLKFGTSVEEIMKNEKPVLDSLLDGFKCEF
jgi:hypothetical protein